MRIPEKVLVSGMPCPILKKYLTLDPLLNPGQVEPAEQERSWRKNQLRNRQGNHDDDFYKAKLALELSIYDETHAK